MRRKYQITRSRVQLHNRLESLLEEACIKISSVVSDLLGTSARRMLHAVGDAGDGPKGDRTPRRVNRRHSSRRYSSRAARNNGISASPFFHSVKNPSYSARALA